LTFFSLVIGIALAISVGTVAGYLGANNVERPALALAGFVYGFVGVRYVIGLIVGAIRRTSRPWLRELLLSLILALLGGSTIAGSVYIAVNLPPNVAWYARITIIGLFVALAVAGCRELIANFSKE
jgi:hypothetical protein